MNQQKDKKQIILDIATRIFSRYGYNKTSLDEIAAEAGIAKGTVYYYFPSKEELFINVVEIQVKELVDTIRGRVREVDGFENKLRTLVQEPIRHIYENMPIWMDGLKSIPFSGQDRFLNFRRANRQATLDLMAEIMEVGKKEGVIDPDLHTEDTVRVISDWILMGNSNVVITDFERLLAQIERDHEAIMHVVLYGVYKRG
ncbi:MAG: TetR/AcrR family transcriptional regulator [Candidatus Cloacimonadaceae bacterium]|jgi:AcrR family transcriptional regulator|nr:TetR/AcrR family transcriptional regulator [Candidatus Cloacimonadota bacterium]MDY0127120.1 TetR/AcrR family transcriptional regulator [Candidatus Cloacimonadaceae bacterium]MCB5254836.1 TetR/AcrR family transcriptional regulator [Candidatus Cloacimonadota bacterium]MCK9178444.1 TetR/AcrR family transcriptional regulator [Candidatus Cloacimonadota bacterium]MCK9243048.1 TetR/AcrR family transcriptional regulator [Candidatus Cloacimonadota bacterium]